MNSTIAAIEYYLPEAIVTNAQLASENPDWSIEAVEKKSGVFQRHIAAQHETACDLAKLACNKLFISSPLKKEQIDGIIFCTQSPDYVMPPNSHLLQSYLGLSDNILAFDFNLACSGYVYGLAIADSLIKTARAQNILLVTADTYSKFINPKDRSTRVLFGDGAAVSWIKSLDNNTLGFIDFALASHGSGFESFYIPAGGAKQPKSAESQREATTTRGITRCPENIHMDGLAVWSFINSAVPKQIRSILERNNLRLADIDQFIFHQASQLTLTSLTQLLELPKEKVFMNMANIGNTVSASIPIAIKDAQVTQQIEPGQLLLLSGFGVGLSYASAIVRI